MRGAGVQSNQSVDRSSKPRRAQVECVAVLANGRIVSGSEDRTLKVWDPSTGACLQTLCVYGTARGRRPVEPCVDRSSTPRGAQVRCVTVQSNGRVVSAGSDDRTLKVWVDCDEAKMARLIALRRLKGMNVKTAWRLIDKFL